MRKNNGQSIIEYTALVMLIVVGVIVMGPYIVRSIGAHFKLWQQSIDDSVNDRMQKIPVTITPSCACTGDTPGGCGVRLPRSNQLCQVDERAHFSKCDPPTCGYGTTNYTESCVHDSSCCAIYNACSLSNNLSACCGSVPLTGAPRVMTDPNGMPAAPNPNPSDPTSYCYFGEELAYNQCDSTKIQCKTNSECSASCVGNIPHDQNGVVTATLCPGANQGLTQDVPLTLTNSCYTGTIQQRPTHYIKVYVDNAVTIYSSDASGTQGNFIYSTPYPGSTKAFATGYTFLLDVNPDLDNYILVDVQDHGGIAGISVQDTTLGTCFSQVNTTYPLGNISSAWGNSPCWINSLPINQSTRLLLKVAGPVTPPIGPCSDCPNYTTNPTATKCVAQCNPGYRSQTDVNGTIYCVRPLAQTFIVAPALGVGIEGSHIVNDQSFTMCNGAKVTSLSLTGTGCGNPGTPGASCVATIW